MPIKLDLTTPITTSETTTEYHVTSYMMDTDSIAFPGVPPPVRPYTEPGVVRIRVRDNAGNYLDFQYAEAEAIGIILEVNTKNFTATSVHEWLLARLVADGMLPAGTVTGSPDTAVEAGTRAAAAAMFPPASSVPIPEVTTAHVVGSKAAYGPTIAGGAVGVVNGTIAGASLVFGPMVTQFTVTYVGRAEGYLSGIETELTSLPTNAFAAVAGNALVVFVQPNQAAGSVGTVTVTDTAGNTFLPISSQNFFRDVRIFYCANILGHAANVVTASLSGAGARPFSVVVRQFSGLGAIASVAVGEGSSTAPSTFYPLPIYAPTAALVAFIATFNSGGITAGSGFDLATNYAGKYQGNLFADESKIVSGSEAATATCINGFWQIIAIAIDGAGGPGGGTLAVTGAHKASTAWLNVPTVANA